MAFLRKAGNVVERTMSMRMSQKILTPKHAIFQAIRCMSTSKLFVGGLSYSTDDATLTEAFSKYGDVAEARVIVDRDTGRSRGFGFVTYSSVDDASAAIQALDQQELQGRRVRVNYANDRPRSYGSGGYGGGGFGGGNYGGGYNSNNYGGGDYGRGGGGYGAAENPNSGYNGGNLSYGGDGERFGGAGGRDAGSNFERYEGFGDKFGSEQSVQMQSQDEGFSQGDPSDANFRDDEDLPGNYAERRG